MKQISLKDLNFTGPDRIIYPVTVRIKTGAADAYLKKYQGISDLFHGVETDKNKYAFYLRQVEGQTLDAAYHNTLDCTGGKKNEKYIVIPVEYKGKPNSMIIDNDPAIVEVS